MSKGNAQGGCKSYHHGDLRNALIVAAAELIEEKGSPDFTMAEAARRARVSSAAPYRHFEDKEALLQAVAEVAFLALRDATRAAAQRETHGTTASLIALGKVYVRFVTDHPSFYDLMWGDLGVRRLGHGDPELKESGFFILVESVQAWCDQGGLSDYNPLELAVKLWAMAHGLACLAMNHNIDQFIPEADIFVLFESSANTFLDGLRPPGSAN